MLIEIRQMGCGLVFGHGCGMHGNLTLSLPHAVMWFAVFETAPGQAGRKGGEVDPLMLVLVLELVFWDCRCCYC